MKYTKILNKVKRLISINKRDGDSYFRIFLDTVFPCETRLYTMSVAVLGHQKEDPIGL